MGLFNLWVSCAAIVLTVGCADAPPTGDFALRMSDMRANAVARDRAEIADASAVAARAELGATRPLALEAAPFLQFSPLGQRFRAAPPPRALAIGSPGPSCPGAGVGADAASALRTCLAANGGRPDCGCEVLAVNDTLLPSTNGLNYAPGVSGRLYGLRDPLGPLVVEERALPDDGVIVAFYAPDRLVALGELRDDGAARLVVAGTGALYVGDREKRGWRRGRLTERLLLRGENGRRLIALIGFEPEELASRRAELTRWPEGPR